MGTSGIAFTFLSAMFFMAVVAWVSYLKTRGEADTRAGYFLAGRGLTGWFIAGSMLLTNLSAEQLIGLNGSAYGHNLSSMAWEVTVSFATIILALVFLPRYLAGAFSTLPEFLRSRFDDDVRRLTRISHHLTAKARDRCATTSLRSIVVLDGPSSTPPRADLRPPRIDAPLTHFRSPRGEKCGLTALLFLVGYGLVTIPSVLYSGSLAVLRIFDVPAMLGVDDSTALWITVALVAIVGGLYAIFGGLKAVAVSDTLNGIGLLVIGAVVPLLALAKLGSGSISAGLSVITSTHVNKLNAIGGADDPTPFGTIFTGMSFANLFYWGTNQYVIQRTRGARDLAEGQKGVLLSGYRKLLVPFMMMIPAVIAFHLYGPGLQPIDVAYPQLVRDVLPGYLSGFLLAVLLGAVFSSFNSLLHSSATLFCLDLYLPLQKNAISDERLITIAKRAGVVIALFSIGLAPMFQYAPEGLWQIIRIFTGFYNIPVIAVVVIGLFTRHVPPLGAKLAVLFHVTAYGLLQFVIRPDIHFIHLYGILFVIEVLLMLAIGWFRPLEVPYVAPYQPKVSLTPWRYAPAASANLLSLVALVYVVFSPLGLAGGELGQPFWLAVGLIVALDTVACLWLYRSTQP